MALFPFKLYWIGLILLDMFKEIADVGRAIEKGLEHTQSFNSKRVHYNVCILLEFWFDLDAIGMIEDLI